VDPSRSRDEGFDRGAIAVALPDRSGRAWVETLFDDLPRTRFRWPLDVESVQRLIPSDPYVAIVRVSVLDYAAGRSDIAQTVWADHIVWRVRGDGRLSGEYRGAEAIFDYHRRIQALTGGTFHQVLVAFQTSGGPVVDAHLRTVASRRDRTLSISTRLVFEIAAGRVQTVTEFPGDQEAWEGFWRD
jgi:ketosteroid isomerase-like protein